MHPAVIAWTALLAALASLAEPARADARRIAPCSGPAAWVDGDTLVISWVGEAERVRVTGIYSCPRRCLASNPACSSL